MNIMLFIGGFLLGLGLGVGVMWFLRKQTQDAFANLSYNALSRNSEEFLRLAAEKFATHAELHAELGEKGVKTHKEQINETVKTLRGDLEKVQTLMTSLEKDRHQKFGELAHELKRSVAQTERLQQTTGQLHQALANTKTRGQWGERMAEDVLRLAGFVENINYFKQQTLEEGTGRPDYTFMLPQGQKVHMDVKFPLDNYLLYLDAQTEHEKQAYAKQFLVDTKNRIKEATKRGYVDKTQGTVDYVLVFIPNEQVYAFIHERDNTILDEALRQKVILCSPMTLYAVLAVIRQAVENFQLERTAGQMLTLFGVFKKEWAKFVEQLLKVEKKFQETSNAFSQLTGPRRNQLERPLNKIEELHQEEPLPAEITEKYL